MDGIALIDCAELMSSGGEIGDEGGLTGGAKRCTGKLATAIQQHDRTCGGLSICAADGDVEGCTGLSSVVACLCAKGGLGDHGRCALGECARGDGDNYEREPKSPLKPQTAA